MLFIIDKISRFNWTVIWHFVIKWPWISSALDILGNGCRIITLLHTYKNLKYKYVCVPEIRKSKINPRTSYRKFLWTRNRFINHCQGHNYFKQFFRIVSIRQRTNFISFLLILSTERYEGQNDLIVMKFMFTVNRKYNVWFLVQGFLNFYFETNMFISQIYDLLIRAWFEICPS